LSSYPFVVSSAASASSPVILDLGWMELREVGIVLGLSTALRILAAFALTLMFALTTDPLGFVRALVQQWRPPHRVAMGLWQRTASFHASPPNCARSGSPTG
jgi:energy-coupling factor transporter transmembrane protein EcfT